MEYIQFYSYSTCQGDTISPGGQMSGQKTKTSWKAAQENKIHEQAEVRFRLSEPLYHFDQKETDWNGRLRTRICMYIRKE